VPLLLLLLLPRIPVLWISLFRNKNLMESSDEGRQIPLDRELKVFQTSRQALDEDSPELAGRTVQVNLDLGERRMVVNGLEHRLSEMASPVLAREVVDKKGLQLWTRLNQSQSIIGLVNNRWLCIDIWTGSWFGLVVEIHTAEFTKVDAGRGVRVTQEPAGVGNVDSERSDQAGLAEDGPCLMAFEVGETDVTEGLWGEVYAPGARDFEAGEELVF
jgi:hypothetical protein